MSSSSRLKKIRSDILLSEQSDLTLDECRKDILAGLVRLNKDYVITKPSELVPMDAILILNGQKQYVSRGAYKIKEAIEKYANELTNFIAADIGASTGGFTDLMIQHGVRKVYAIDVGYGQLHYKLQKDSRIVSMERFNARNIKADTIPEKVDIFTVDVSFISLKLILKNIDLILKDGGLGFILIKPQFEAKYDEIDKGGIVTNPEIIQKYIRDIETFTEDEIGWKNLDLLKSPIKGPKGNQEYTLVIEKSIL